MRSDRVLFGGMERNLKRYHDGYANPDFDYSAVECARAASIVLYLYNWRADWFNKAVEYAKRLQKQNRAYLKELDRREKAHKARGGKTIRAKV